MKIDKNFFFLAETIEKRKIHLFGAIENVEFFCWTQMD